jgi:hypothetical protein
MVAWRDQVKLWYTSVRITINRWRPWSGKSGVWLTALPLRYPAWCSGSDPPCSIIFPHLNWLSLPDVTKVILERSLRILFADCLWTSDLNIFSFNKTTLWKFRGNHFPAQILHGALSENKSHTPFRSSNWQQIEFLLLGKEKEREKQKGMQNGWFRPAAWQSSVVHATNFDVRGMRYTVNTEKSSELETAVTDRLIKPLEFVRLRIYSTFRFHENEFYVGQFSNVSY